jgi:hypothetical protein
MIKTMEVVLAVSTMTSLRVSSILYIRQVLQVTAINSPMAETAARKIPMASPSLILLTFRSKK